ncbi:MAG: ABC transporter ATP-binding protein/permease [Candidatus Hydrogenedentes bacterium]|nr:ABC transporter ATP-binding protein/permease [Candidatus Hydrogenedentota bacterium]
MKLGSPTFWRFLRYARPYWPYILGSVLTGVVKFTLALLIPYALGYVVDNIILAEIPDEEKMTRLFQVVGILFAVFIGRIPISYYRSYWAELAGNRTIFDIRNDLYAHVQKLSLSYHAKQRTGATTSRLTNDINIAQGILDRGVMSVGVDLIFLVSVVTGLFFWNWQLASVSLFTLPMYAIVFGVLNPKLRVASRNVQSQMSNLSGEINEKLMGQPVVMAFVRERTERLRFFREHRAYFTEIMKRVRIHVSMFQFGEFFTMIGPVVVICFGTYLVIHGSLKPGALVTFSGFLSHLYLPTRRLADASAAVQMQLAGMDRVFELLDVEPEIADLPNATPLLLTEGRISFDDVHFSYLDGQPVLQGITLTVTPGEALAIVGRSGGGKSTLIKLVPRFYDVDSGAIRIDGQDIREVTQHSLREKIGMVMQDAILFDGTVRENILYGRRGATEADMLEASRMAHVDEFVSELPEAYDTTIGERGVTLSGGQKQRLSIARAFLRDPEILILDEATSSLDSHAENIIQDALEHLMKGRTTLVIAHRLATIIDCDRVVVIEDGRIVQEGTHDGLLNEDGPYRALCEEQFGAVQLEDLAR